MARHKFAQDVTGHVEVVVSNAECTDDGEALEALAHEVVHVDLVDAVETAVRLDVLLVAVFVLEVVASLPATWWLA